jgi:hypothetical protein
MTIATMHDALPFFEFAALALAGCAAPALWALWTVRGRAWAWRLAAAITAVGGIAIAASGEPAWLLLVAAVVGFAVLARRTFERGGRMVAAALIVVAGFPLYAITLFLAVLGFAATGCAPDAYECPI